MRAMAHELRCPHCGDRPLAGGARDVSLRVSISPYEAGARVRQEHADHMPAASRRGLKCAAARSELASDDILENVDADTPAILRDTPHAARSHARRSGEAAPGSKDLSGVGNGRPRRPAQPGDARGSPSPNVRSSHVERDKRVDRPTDRRPMSSLETGERTSAPFESLPSPVLLYAGRLARQRLSWSPVVGGFFAGGAPQPRINAPVQASARGEEHRSDNRLTFPIPFSSSSDRKTRYGVHRGHQPGRCQRARFASPLNAWEQCRVAKSGGPGIWARAPARRPSPARDSPHAQRRPSPGRVHAPRTSAPPRLPERSRHRPCTSAACVRSARRTRATDQAPRQSPRGAETRRPGEPRPQSRAAPARCSEHAPPFGRLFRGRGNRFRKTSFAIASKPSSS